MNGNKAASTENMLVAHEINIMEHLGPGRNELLVHIRPALPEAEKYGYNQMLLAGKNHYFAGLSPFDLGTYRGGLEKGGLCR